MRPQALDALRDCDLIIHAGDVGEPKVLEALRALAPVHAVRGNVDYGDWAEQLPMTARVAVGDVAFHVLHDIAQLDSGAPSAGCAVIVYGHSHRPSIETRDGVLYLNPGSAGPRRFDLPVSLALVRITSRGLSAEIVTLAT